MDRPIVYDQAQARDYDVLYGWRLAMVALGQLGSDFLGAASANTVVTGFAATADSPADLSINLAAGDIYAMAAIDSAVYGALASNSSLILQQGIAAAQKLTLTTAGLSSGQSRWALVQAAFAQSDAIPSDDPNGGVLPYLNINNPSGPPWSGPANSGSPQNTRRQGLATVQVVYGTVATTGSEVPPNPTAGFVPLYLIDLAYGQTQIQQSQILTAGPSVGTGVPSNYPAAPFLTGLLGASPTAGGSHHGGVPGQAAKVNFATELQNFNLGWDLSAPPSSDTALAVGQRAIVTFESVSAIPLKIAVTAGQIFRVMIVVTSSNTTNADIQFKPNNTTYTGAFNCWQIEDIDSALSGLGSATSLAAFATLTTPSSFPGQMGNVPIAGFGPGNAVQNDFAFDLFYGPQNSNNDVGPWILEIVVCTTTAAKMCLGRGGIQGGPSIHVLKWADTTTAWTSLGTIADGGTSATGTAVIERIA